MNLLLGCLYQDGSCLSVWEDIDCGNLLYNICISRKDCDVFSDNVCGKKIIFENDCKIVGETVCLESLDCIWKEGNGCVAKDDEGVQTFNSLFIICLLLIFFLLFKHICVG
jgi:hypothetical protein